MYKTCIFGFIFLWKKASLTSSRRQHDVTAQIEQSPARAGRSITRWRCVRAEPAAHARARARALQAVPRLGTQGHWSLAGDEQSGGSRQGNAAGPNRPRSSPRKMPGRLTVTRGRLRDGWIERRVAGVGGTRRRLAVSGGGAWQGLGKKEGWLARRTAGSCGS